MRFRSAIGPYIASTAILVAICGCSESSEAPASGEAAVPVTVAHPLKKRIVEWDRYIGRFAAIEQVEVRSRVGGFIDSIHFDEGTVVEQGQTLIVIDQAPLQAAVAEAKGVQREAESAKLQAEAALKEAQAKKLQATAQELLTKNQVIRARQLVDTRTLTREEFEIRVAEYETAKADVEAADAGIEASNAAIEAADAAIASATARLETATLELSYATISAPITGRVGERLVTPGNLITGGSAQGTLLTTIVAIDPIHVVFDASEREYLKYARLDREGSRNSSRNTKNPVYVKLSDETVYQHVGHMDFVDNRLGRETGTIRGRAIFRNPDGSLTPGLFAEVRIPGSGAYDAILIPDEAIANDQNEQIAFVVNSENRIDAREIVTGPIVDGLRVVRSGLSADDLVVVQGLQLVRAGALVEPSDPVSVTPIDDGLPDDYEPVPESEWIRPRTAPLASDAEATEPESAGNEAPAESPAAAPVETTGAPPVATPEPADESSADR